jgi:tetratricopeptide (TPR) repeat protein
LRCIGLQQAGLLGGLLLLLLTGCAAPQTRGILQQANTLPEQAFISDVPFYPQEKFYCGPASLAMMLNWAGIPANQEDIAKLIYTPGRQGTLPVDILSGSRRNGALAVEVNTLHDLLNEIAAGHPVLVFQNLGLKMFPIWHFAVVIGYDLNERTLILHSGVDSQRFTDLYTFEKTWQRAEYWAVTIMQADSLPKAATELSVLKAASGLEQAGQYNAAITAYNSISERWPQSTIAHIGLGNTYYKLGNFSAAARSFKMATQIDTSNAAAWNNLANALAAQGLYQDAVTAAHNAVANSGVEDTIYRNTLEEISTRQVNRD